MRTKVSVIWLNYNSMKFMDTVYKSLEAFLNMDFNSYELLIVDNASNDGSFEHIVRFLEERKQDNVKVKIIRNDKNLGYAGGMNAGWEAKDPESKYVAFVNNDLIPAPYSLAKLVEYMEDGERVAAASGLIHYPDGKIIYSTGGWIDELWIGGGICNGLVADECPGIDKIHYVTYPDGAYMVVRVDAIKRVMPNGKPFIDETFLYLDDSLLGLILWNRGYQVKYIPIDIGIHYQGMVTRGSLSNFYGVRGSTALSLIVKTRYSNTLISRILRSRRLFYLFINKVNYRGFIDGMQLANVLIEKVGVLNLYCAPYRYVTPLEVTSELLLLRRRYLKVKLNELKIRNRYL
ncbi:hypothetical protein GCM10007981_00890 [Thermocladium modestius]|uniref:Glycosyltransferase 2-like domain-containing protein n=1 Tax=Thermocladium modestius TaxID=62609 RepID=A0A830GTA4_9CREN|nr:glycosyltransferase family 2 protein [Thermocladium modestius]GGP18995.1 hypothetical protein GCM10007981_00890 [Thermocladium modestius]